VLPITSVLVKHITEIYTLVGLYAA